MVLKTAFILAILGLIGLTQGASLSQVSSSNSNDETVGQKENNEIKELESMLLREMLENAALKSQLRNLIEIVNTQVADESNSDAAAEASTNDDDNNNGRTLIVAKRFPKWRSGDTRSRVRLLHQNDGRHQSMGASSSSSALSPSSSNNHYNYNSPTSTDYSALLRNRWENNMLEKNRMYQNLLG